MAFYSDWKGEGDPPYQRPGEFWRLMYWAEKALTIKGDFCEFGVFRGGTAGQLCRLLRDSQDNGIEKTLHLFDAWSDNPDSSKVVRSEERKHGLEMTRAEYLNITKANIQKIDPNHIIPVHYYQGLFEATTKDLTFPVSFIHFDADLYKSCCDTLAFALKNLSKGGVIVFHDASPY